MKREIKNLLVLAYREAETYGDGTEGSFYGVMIQRLVDYLALKIKPESNMAIIKTAFIESHLTFRNVIDKMNKQGKIQLDRDKFKIFINANPQLGVRFSDE
jgi:hypothetical protein